MSSSSWECEDKSAAFPDPRTGDPNPPTLGFNEMSGDGQADPAASSGTRTRFVGPVETGEKVR